MTDIVELLENLNVEHYQQAIINSAVDEIERLREALNCYTCDCKDNVCKERHLNCGQAARDALEGKE
jgi:hypothetical protein